MFAGFDWNPMFRPSHDSLLRQNEEIDRLDLPRIQDDDELEALKTKPGAGRDSNRADAANRSSP